jgi:phosphoglycolate phosphatase-like HAD superfamily hydrolase
VTGGAEDEVAPRGLVVFDVDGVLADVEHRLHHLEGPRKDWRAFFAAAGADPPLPTGLELARELAADHDLAYLTGRPESLRRVTQRWLSRHGLPEGPLWMRPPGDFRPARVMKLAALRSLAGDLEVEVVVDDDAQVVDALRDAGFAVLQATWAVQSRSHGRTLRRAQEEQGRT